MMLEQYANTHDMKGIPTHFPFAAFVFVLIHMSAGSFSNFLLHYNHITALTLHKCFVKQTVTR